MTGPEHSGPRPLPRWQGTRLATLLDALGGVPVTDAERASLAWVCGFEAHTVEHLAAVIRRAREGRAVNGPDVLNTTTVPEWMTGGVCAQVDPELWFPEKGGSTRQAKQLCARCPVRPECLAYALAHDERFGVWGGASEGDRRRMKRTATRPQGASVRAPDKRTGVIRQLATTLTDPEIAARLGCSPRTVLRIRAAGGIPPAHPSRRRMVSAA